MYDALVDACERVDASSEVRVFVVRARGATFCTGTDISQFASFSTRAEGLEYERRLEACVSRLERVMVPTIAQIEGVAAGGGCAIALACDLRVCSPAGPLWCADRPHARQRALVRKLRPARGALRHRPDKNHVAGRWIHRCLPTQRPAVP
jgi:hypothetical protein